MKYLLEGERSERILFRKIALSDFDSWLKFHANPETSLHWNTTRKSPKVECEQWYETQFRRYENDMGGMNALVEEESGKLIGHCGLLVQTVDEVTELEIGYSLLSEFWNRGFATEAAKKCMNVAFERKYAESLISIISITNTPSEKVAIKNGMKKTKQTNYKGNAVNIFRITESEWIRLNE